ncbi:MAG: hypothetical protein MSC30_04965 [Gaiellaceae bacterium MAG52_C11]|nr:hypothetical protein [Candidatus Gaiellasilicea maunaloa]
MEPKPQVETPPFAVTCLECGTVDYESKGWKAYLSEERTLLVYCTECAEREFGD